MPTQYAQYTTLPDAFRGYALSFGGQVNAAAPRFLRVNSVNNGTTDPALDERNEAAVPTDGIIRAFGWHTKDGDATTVMKIHKNGAVVATITLTGASGANETLNITVRAGDRVGLEFDAGTQPDNGNYQMLIQVG